MTRAIGDCAACGTPLGKPVRIGSLPLPRALQESGATQVWRWDIKISGCGGCGSLAILGSPPTSKMLASLDRPSTSTTSTRHRLAREAQHTLSTVPIAQGEAVVAVGAGDGLLLKPFRDAGYDVTNIEPAASRRALAEADGIPTVDRPLGGGAADRLDELGVHPTVVLARTVLGRVGDPDDVFLELAGSVTKNARVLFTLPDVDSALQLSPVGLINPEWRWLWTPHALSLIALRHGMIVEHVDGTASPGAWTCTVAWARGDSPFPLARPSTSVIDLVADYPRRLDFWRRVLDRHLTRMTLDERMIVAVGAGATGVTALNMAGLDVDRVGAVLDLNPFKQGRLAPGVNIPIAGTELLHPGDHAEMLTLVEELEPELRSQHADLLTTGTLLRSIALTD